MGTPFVKRQEPTRLDAYNRLLPHDQQSAYISPTFIHAMSVREKVFAQEQRYRRESEQDADDAKACHWVMYASVNTIKEPEERDPVTDLVIRRRRSETKTVPIAALRIVPFPHPPHPPVGSHYVGGILQADDYVPPVASSSNANNNKTKDIKNNKTNENASPHENGNHNGNGYVTKDYFAEPKVPEPPRHRALSLNEHRRLFANKPFGPDRPTDFHNGKEPYYKLGRVAVLPEYRGDNAGKRLWDIATQWLQENPTYFNPSVRELGSDVMKVTSVNDIPKWNGLVCIHAQEALIRVYESWGFQVDNTFGKFYQDGIPHVGMWTRLPIDARATEPRI